jgi:ketosteroid isomerase-like protein
MKKAAVVIVALMTGACSDGSLQIDTAADEAAIRDLISQTEGFNNSADSLGWVSLFEDGAVYMPAGTPAVNTESGLRDMAATGFGSYQADIRIEPVEIVILGEWAFARSNVSGTVTPRAGGDAIPVDVKQLVLYRRQADGSWKIARFISNGNS